MGTWRTARTQGWTPRWYESCACFRPGSRALASRVGVLPRGGVPTAGAAGAAAGARRPSIDQWGDDSPGPAEPGRLDSGSLRRGVITHPPVGPALDSSLLRCGEWFAPRLPAAGKSPGLSRAGAAAASA